MKTPRFPRRVLVMGGVAAAMLVGFGAGALTNSLGADAQTTTSTPTPKSAAADHMDGRCGDKAPLNDATAAKVKAAALDAVSGATVDHVGHDHETDGYVAMLTKSDGTTHVLVHEDAKFKVTKVEDPAPARTDHGPDGRGHGGRPNDNDADDTGTSPTTSAAS